MARYIQTAQEANVVAKKLFQLVPEEHRNEAAQHIARLVNYGLRCSPRAVQSTVRLNAVREAVRGLPVEVSMEKVQKDNGYSFNALVLNGTRENGNGE